jgi:hypothetical protein
MNVPQGYTADAASAELHDKAQAYAEANDCSFVDALRAIDK